MSARPTSRTLGDLLDEMAAERPHAQALAFHDEQLTYAALRARVDELARALVAVGVTRGDRVAVLLPNRPEWVVAALAIAKIGGIVSAISTFSTARELGWMLEHSEAVALITVSAFRGRAYLDALHDLCPELAASAPGALRSERLPRLRTVVCSEAAATPHAKDHRGSPPRRTRRESWGDGGRASHAPELEWRQGRWTRRKFAASSMTSRPGA